MSRLAIILPPDAASPIHWAMVADGGVGARGTGDDWPRLAGIATPAWLIAPAAAVTLHRALLPDLAPRQAGAAARLMAVENALGDPDDLHVAVGPRDPDGALDVAVVARADMVVWLEWAGLHALDVQAIVPAALLLPRPAEGFVRGRIGAEAIARDAASAFALDPAFGALLLGDAPVVDVSVNEQDAALAAALDASPLDLRQGAFARRRRRDLDWALVRRAAVLTGLILLSTLTLSLVRIARLHAATAQADAAALAAARTVLPDVADVAQAATALDAQAAERGLGGRGFAAGAARLFAALEQTPTMVLTDYNTAADGVVRATLSAPTAGELDSALAAVRAAGAGTTATPVTGSDGRPSAQITLVPQ